MKNLSRSLFRRGAAFLLVPLLVGGCGKILGPSAKEKECLAFLDAATIDSAAVVAFDTAKGDFVDPKISAAALAAMTKQIDAVGALKLSDATLTSLQPRYTATRKTQRDALTSYEAAAAKLSDPKWVPPEGFSEKLQKSATEADTASKAYTALFKEVNTTCNIH